MEKIDAMWAIILLPVIMFGPPLVHEIWSRRKEKARASVEHIEEN